MEPLGNILPTAHFTANAPDQPGAPPCPICQGMGYLRYDVPYGDPNFGKIVPCQCRAHQQDAERTTRVRERSRMGPLEHKHFGTIDVDRATSAFSRDALVKAVDAAQQYARDPQGWLVLTGPSGSGKSHIAAAIANQVLEHDDGVLWMFVPDFLDHLRTTFSPTSNISYDQLFATVRDTALLVLDDLGAQSSSPWAEEKLYQILAHRYDRALPTVITTTKLLDTFDGRMRSRLQDPSIGHVVPVVGYSSEVVNRLMGLSYDLINRMTFESFNPQPYSPAEAQRNRYNLAEVYTFVQSFVRKLEQRRWLVLMGRHGGGKTHLAAAMANDRLRRGLPTLFMVTPDLLDALRASFSGEGDASYDKVLYEVRSTPFLILDDFGTQSASAWAREKLYQVLNHRYNAQLPTVITTNLALEEIDPPLQSRMSDQEYCGVIAVLAPDYRKHRGDTWRFRGK